MDNNNEILSKRKFIFPETSFEVLMRTRIVKVLLICSNYDAFMLEEDGRIDEQIFNEYVSLNLRYPPQVIQVSNASDAFKKLEEEEIDLIIEMLSIGEMEAFDLAKKIKKTYREIPIVLLTPFSNEITLKLEKEDTSSFDFIFCWLGNTDILLAIIKLIEDKMNVNEDIKNVGVQAILLVENSIRFYSSYLPNIYKIIFKQSRKFMSEGLNEHQKMLRLRGRPKILLATNFEEAIELYEKYKNNLLGVISDVRYDRNGKSDRQAGIKLIQKIKQDDKYMPLLLQSSDAANCSVAKKLQVGFIDKNSKYLSIELRKFINEYFAFGDFIFRDPSTGYEVGRASNLKAIQKALHEIPDNSLEYHITRNHISKWLNARALFPLAELFKSLSIDDFKDLQSIRIFLYEAISNFRLNKGRGIIAKFYKENYDEYLNFTRIGDGSIGGKARGLAFLDSLIKKNPILDEFKNVIISIPRTVVLTTEIFDEFMEMNNLYDLALSDADDEIIFKAFIEAKIPVQIIDDLITFINVSKNPIAVRSSSLLEDSHYQPFAGVYATYMIPKVDDNKKMVKILTEAIKSVYASVYMKSSKSYMTATRNVIDEEKMSIVLQEVCGHNYGDRFYPTISGVARSINFYPIGKEVAEDGVANICLGLGKQIVEGGRSLRFSLKHPTKILQLSDTASAVRDTQKEFYALDLKYESFRPSTDDSVNLQKLKIKDAEKDNSLKFVASIYDYKDNTIKEGEHYEGRKIITFSNILKYEAFPLARILEKVTEIAKKAINSHIEIEFAMNLPQTKNEIAEFNLLQIRPIVDNSEKITTKLEDIAKNETIIYSNQALGNGSIKGLNDIIYVKTSSFDSSNNSKIAEMVDKINSKFIKEGKNYILIGPGRWGSTDKWLGIPVKWANISNAKVIIESGLPEYRIDPSQGTHFFQNLTSFRIGYLTLNPYADDGFYDVDYLDKLDSFWENEFVRHIRFENDLIVKIDGKKNIGLIMEEEKFNKYSK
ncbi:MAG: phosphoenolpyruvate synthase [Bacteroidales bacterium]|nr:phosphoenolpyruvate synthase [Bacteroidales bacterium]MBN2758601.1 phosphoenolpyruvate synthase [Bacteroidales bacterium]